MVTRFVYRTLSVVFHLIAIVCWLIGLALVVAPLTAPSPDWSMLAIGIWGFILAFMLVQIGGEAWRAGRYDPLYD